MGRSACCDENGLKKGPWTEEEDEKLVKYMERYGGRGGGRGGISWRQVPKLAGLKRCGKSCRLRWTNYLRPDIKRGNLSHQEEQTIINLHALVGNKWSAIASNLPGRTDNEIKNFWNTHLKKKLLQMGIDPVTHTPITTPHNHHISTTATSTLPPQLLAATYNNLMSNNTTPWDLALLQYLNSVHATQIVAEILRGQGLVISNSTTPTPTTTNSYDHYPYILGMEMEAAVANYYNYLLGSSPSSSTSVPDHQLVYHHGHGLGYDYADLNMINRHSSCPQAASLGNTITTSHYDHHDEYSSKFAIANMKARSRTDDDHNLKNELYHDHQGGHHHHRHHQLPVLVSAATSPYVVTSTHDTANDLIAGMDDDHQEATNDQSYWKRHIMDIDIASSQIWPI